MLGAAVVVALGAVLGAAGLAGLFIYYGRDPNLPTVASLKSYHPKQLTRILDRHGTLVGELGTEKRTFVPFAQIPKTLVNAVIAAEDAHYFEHGGLDYKGILRAFIENVLRGRTAQGGSTITQQVIKTFLLTPERTVRRKVQEIILARQLDAHFTKEEVLELYLNQINYGHGRYGCEEAARYYFGKSVRDIDTAEAALLAGIPQSPARLSPRRHPEAAKTRQRYVLGQMAENGFIDRATADRLALAPIRLAREPAAAKGLAAEAVDTVGRELASRLGAPAATQGGLTVSTTIDARLQQLARDALEHGLEDLDARQGFRGPSGHLTGKALEKHRASLAAAHHGGLKDGEIVEGLVKEIRKPTAPAGGPGVLVVDIGGGEGAVDLSLETRYAKGAKPLAERFVPGDVVRVRLAPERARPAAPPSPSPEKQDPKDHEQAWLPLALELGPQAAMVVLDPATREILALVGGYDYQPGAFDRSQRAKRQPGSSFKPIVYAAAIASKRLTAASIVNDAPEVYELWKPQNYEKEEFRGPVRLRVALAHSINTVAIKVLSEIGVPAVRDMATKLGFSSPIPEDAGLALALGPMDATPLEMANVYAAFDSQGQRGEPILVKQINNEVLPGKPLEPAIPAEVAYVITSMMRSVIDEGTARAAAGKLRRPAAGKTGTSNASRDAWFVGYTPELVAAVWVGFDDRHKLGHGEAGARSALPIWLDFMTKALAGKPVRDFVQPPGVVVQRIDKATGLLPAPGQEATAVDEVFLEGTAPTATAPRPGEGQSADQLLLGQ